MKHDLLKRFDHLNQDLLQVTVEDRAMIFDLQHYDESSRNFVAIRDYAFMKQLLDPELFVCSEYNMQEAYSLPKDGKAKVHVCREIYVNRSREFFLQLNRSSKSLQVKEGENVLMPRRCDGAYKTYDENDF